MKRLTAQPLVKCHTNHDPFYSHKVKGSGAEEYLSGFQFMGRKAVRIAFLADGTVSSIGRLLDSPEGWFRIGRLDMESVQRETASWMEKHHDHQSACGSS